MIIQYVDDPNYVNDKDVYLQFWLDIFNRLSGMEHHHTNNTRFRFGKPPHAIYTIKGLHVIAKRHNEPILSFKSEVHDTFYPDITPMHIFNLLERMFVLTTEQRRIIYAMIPDDIGDILFKQLQPRETL